MESWWVSPSSSAGPERHNGASPPAQMDSCTPHALQTDRWTGVFKVKTDLSTALRSDGVTSLSAGRLPGLQLGVFGSL